MRNVYRLAVLLALLSACGGSVESGGVSDVSDSATSFPSSEKISSATSSSSSDDATSHVVDEAQEPRTEKGVHTKGPATPTSATAPATAETADVNSKITLLNFSSVSTEDLEVWSSFAANKMAEQNANVLVVLYHIGQNLGPEDPARFSGAPFTPNQVILTQEQIDTILVQIEAWMRADDCMGHREERPRIQEELADYRIWLEQGADTSTQRGLCERTRIIIMAFQEGNPMWDLQRFLVHELYHAFQHDIEGPCNDLIDRNGRGDHVPIVVEGAADYFTYFTAGELYGDSDPVSTMLKEAKARTQEDGSNEVMGSGMATRASALVRLMVERGWLSHERILDGSFFHSCARAELTDSNPQFAYARQNWAKIESRENKWAFSESALTDSP